MSRIGKKPIDIPNGIEVAKDGELIKIKGPKGELVFLVPAIIGVEIADNAVSLREIKTTKQSKALWGTSRALLANMVKGVSEGFAKKLQIEGIGYRAEAKDSDLILHLGFSHPVKINGKAGINFKVEKNIITISGIDKQQVGEIAAKIRAMKKPEPFKGKGIRYVGEVVRRKAGKKAVAAGK